MSGWDGPSVALVGAGPGDPALISLRGRELIASADVIVYDALANPTLLDLAPETAERIDAGKRAREHKLSQGQINELLAQRAEAGKKVVRLKGGDPYVFGRGSEEGLYLHQRGIPVEVVPGITAAVAAAACAGIPLTHRQVAATVTFVTGHEDPSKPDAQVHYAPLAALARRGGTLCFYMGMGRLGPIVARLLEAGLDPKTPAAAIQWGSTPKQRTVRSVLENLAADVQSASVADPAVIVIGAVVEVDPEGALRGFERRPLFGRRILITRTPKQSSTLRDGLENLGAEVIEAPTIRIEPADPAPIDRALKEADRWDWLILTSANGVEALGRRMEALGFDGRHLAGLRIATIGKATAEA
ncbi:MAG: uroporphyrinogen-III C-methyltransferase, partial [Phycisphaeraceae bacterium]|nr:uroporphyrinogen-III C-methyltransferase [Phycisphaeraceae bacterium]